MILLVLRLYREPTVRDLLSTFSPGAGDVGPVVQVPAPDTLQLQIHRVHQLHLLSVTSPWVESGGKSLLTWFISNLTFSTSFSDI